MLNRDPASWPPFPGPDAPEAVRLRWAVERFLPPGARTAPASSSPDPLSRVLALPLDQLDAMLTVRVPWWPSLLYFVPDEADAEALVAAGEATRGAVWTRRELLDLLAVPGITKDLARTVALAKLAVAGEVAEVRAARGAPRCPACKGARFWRSVHGPLQCATCHPPAPGNRARDEPEDREVRHHD